VLRGYRQQPAGAAAPGGKKPSHSQHLRPLTWQQKTRWGFVALLVILGVRTKLPISLAVWRLNVLSV
jgi:hypothetical protein